MLKFATLITVVLLQLPYAAMATEVPHYKMGTGSVGATYYPVGKAICDVVNSENAGFTCEAVPTEGSTYNLQALKKGGWIWPLARNICSSRHYAA